jgi:hypothetical protein
LIWLGWYERIDPVVRIPARFPVIVEPPTRILAGARLNLEETECRAEVHLTVFVRDRSVTIGLHMLRVVGRFL